MSQIILKVTNFLFQPYMYFIFSVIGFCAMIRYREKWTEPKFARGILIGVAVVLGLSMFNDHFRDISTKADNVPIFLMVFSVGFFTWLSFRQAVVNDRRLAQGQPPVEKETSDKKVYVWPDLVYVEFLATIVAGVALLVWSLCLHAPLEQAATPAWTPNPSKAPWYFLGLQEMLVYYDPWLAGVVFPSLIIVGLMAIPYVDKNPKGSGYYTFNERKYAIVPFLFGFLILWVTLIFLGTFLRGPGWNFFGPFEEWDPHKVVVLNNVNLSEYFWVMLLRMGLPHNPLLRELPGFAVLAAYFIALPPLFTKKSAFLMGLLERMGVARYAVILFLAFSMAALPIKMVLRWVFNLKYIVSIPEVFFNI
ncbi:MAG TPA: cytochrome C [bacterium]|nr:cytochrome C [bacterium]